MIFGNSVTKRWVSMMIRLQRKSFRRRTDNQALCFLLSSHRYFRLDVREVAAALETLQHAKPTNCSCQPKGQVLMPENTSQSYEYSKAISHQDQTHKGNGRILSMGSRGVRTLLRHQGRMTGPIDSMIGIPLLPRKRIVFCPTTTACLFFLWRLAYEANHVRGGKGGAPIHKLA